MEEKPEAKPAKKAAPATAKKATKPAKAEAPVEEKPETKPAKKAAPAKAGKATKPARAEAPAEEKPEEEKMIIPRGVHPGQLPPQTEGFTFCNLSNHPVDIHNLVVTDGGGAPVHTVGHLGPIPPQTILNHAFAPVSGVKVSCEVHWAGGPQIDMHSDQLPAGELIAYATYGVRDDHGGPGIHAWGVDVLTTHGANQGL